MAGVISCPLCRGLHGYPMDPVIYRGRVWKVTIRCQRCERQVLPPPVQTVGQWAKLNRVEGAA